MEENEKTQKGGWLIGVGVLFSVYLFAPYILAFPFLILLETKVLPKRAEPVLDIAFAPVDKLYQSCPPYHALLDFERESIARLFHRGSTHF